MALNYVVQNGPENITVRLEGVLELAAHPVFRSLLEDLDRQERAASVTFDLGGVSSIDPAGLGLLLIARRRLGGRRLALRNPCPDVNHVLSLTGFSALVPLVA